MCIDVATFLAALPEFANAGGPSTGSITWLGVGAAGQTIAIGGVEMLAVAGARVAGSETWSVDGTASAQASSFVAALADSEAAETLTAVKSTPTTVVLTTIADGQASELALSTSTPATYELTGDSLTGGGGLLDLQLATACSMVNVAVWKGKAGAGAIYLTAHLMTIAAPNIGGGETGATTSRGIDRISQSNQATAFATTDAAFASTRWGRLYLALKKGLPRVPATTSARACGVFRGY
jgi:hypothetical protein